MSTAAIVDSVHEGGSTNCHRRAERCTGSNI
jgi:hypothetical protein